MVLPVKFVSLLDKNTPYLLTFFLSSRKAKGNRISRNRGQAFSQFNSLNPILVCLPGIPNIKEASTSIPDF